MPTDSNEPLKPIMPSDEDIQARFERIRDELRTLETPVLTEDDELQSKLEQVQKTAGASRMPEVPELNIPKRVSSSTATDGIPGNYNYRGLGIGMSAAYSLVGAMIVGFGLGWGYDRIFHTIYGQVIGSLLGSVLGITTSIFIINKDSGDSK